MRERLTLFAGAVLSVCLGVALVQSSLLLLISAATYDAPDAFADSTDAAVAMLGITVGFAAFLAVFIIGSTFGFTVVQRRRDLALLRLAGASRGQVRRMLLGEAVVLGAAGAALGVPAGVGLMAVQGWMLRTMGFVPPDFTGQWRMWILGVSAGTGVLLSVAGALVAARRAGAVRPLEALRDTGRSARVMTAGRWVAAAVFLAGTVALVVLTPVGGVGGGQALAMNVPLCAAVTAAALSPLLVPAVARMLPLRTGGVIGQLAAAAVRDGRRRSASVAAPVIVLVALVLGQATASASFTASGVAEQRRTTAADLVVESTTGTTGSPAVPTAGVGPGTTAGVGPGTVAGVGPGTVAGVVAVSTEVEVPVRMTTGGGDEAETELGSALIVDPAAYAAAHPGAGDLSALTGAAVATGPGGWLDVGDSVRVRTAGGDLGELPVVARVPEAMSGGPSLLLPAGLVPADAVAGAPVRTFVTVDGDPGPVAAALAGSGRVSTAEDFLAADARARSSISNKILLVVLGLGALYALIGVVNSVVIGAAARRREFAEARATGLTRGQVVRAALLESVLVTWAGLVLGGLAAAPAFVAVMAGTAEVTGTATLDVPWTVAGALAATVLVVTSATSVITSRAATRQRPVALLGAHE